MNNYKTEQILNISVLALQAKNIAHSSICLMLKSSNYFSKELNEAHSRIIESISKSVKTEQAFKLSLLISWAKCIAMNPLNPEFESIRLN